MFNFKGISMLCALAMMAGPILTACGPTTVTTAPTPLSGAQAAATSVPSTVTSVPPTTTPVPPIATSVLPTVFPESKVQSDLLGHVVTSNGQWTPVIQKFDVVEMALVPAGCFEMGSTPAQVEETYQRCVLKWGTCQRSWFEAESPQHEICFKEPFWIDRYEVTNKQYGSSGKFPGDDIPRDSVNWFDAAAFCKRRGGHLPTEAEWQYAARGPDGLAYPWGNTFTGKLLNSCDRNCTMDWRDAEMDDGHTTTSSVGSFPGGASWVGALDMSGNLWEWVSSIHRPYPYDATDGREVDGNADSTSSRVSFGGAWDLDGDHARLAFRNWNEPSFADYAIGFRCARSYTLADAPPTVAPVPPTATRMSTPTTTPAPLPILTGGVIAFTHVRGSNAAVNSQVAVMNADGSGQRTLADCPGWYPDWSPDGKWIVFHAEESKSVWSIYAIDAEGSNLQRLTTGARDASPKWSPDGAQIVFSRNGDIWVMRVSNGSQVSNLRPLTSGPAEEVCPNWSPDGKQIVFSSFADPNDYGLSDLYVMNADGSNVRRLTEKSANNWWPDWSPDGKRIAFESIRGGKSQIYVMNLDGSNVQQLTRNDANNANATWSPDGTRIAFYSDRDGNEEIYVMNADGSNPIRLTQTPTNKECPAWKPTR